MASSSSTQLQPTSILAPISRLRPLDMGRILDHAIRLYRRNFAQFIVISALVQLPTTLTTLLTSGSSLGFANAGRVDPDTLAMISGVNIIIVLLGLIWMQFGACILAQRAADAYLGIASTIGTARRRAGRAWMAVVSAYLLLFFVTMGLIIIFVFPIIGWLLAIPGLGMVAYFGIAVSSLLVPTAVIEKRSGRQSIIRAWNLARTRFWWTLGFFTLLYLFSSVVIQGPLYLLTGILSMVGDGVLSDFTVVILSAVISLLLGVIYYPISVVSALLVYIDLRIRHEGLDLALRALLHTDSEFDAVDAILRTPPATSQRFRPTGSEIGAFTLLTIGGGVVFAVLSLVLGLALLPLFPYLQGGF